MANDSWTQAMQQVAGQAQKGYYHPETGEWVSMGNGGSYTDPTSNLTYMGMNNSGWAGNPEAGNYSVGNYKPGGQYSIYDADGKDTGRKGQYAVPMEFKDMLPYIAMMAGPWALQAAGMLPGAAGGAAAAGGELGLNGAFLGEGVASGIPGWDAAMSAALPAGTAGPALGKAALDGTNAFGANSVPGAYELGAVAPAAASGSSLLNSASNLIKPLAGVAATIAGGAAGAGGGGSGGQQNRMDPRMDEFVYGDLLPRVRGLLDSQSPMALDAQKRLMQTGSGLLSINPAGNGFDRFTKGRY